MEQYPDACSEKRFCVYKRKSLEDELGTLNELRERILAIEEGLRLRDFVRGCLHEEGQVREQENSDRNEFN